MLDRTVTPPLVCILLIWVYALQNHAPTHYFPVYPGRSISQDSPVVVQTMSLHYVPTGKLDIRWMRSTRQSSSQVEVYSPVIDRILMDYPIVPKDLVIAFILAESQGKKEARNRHTGACGLMQLTPIAIREVERIYGDKGNEVCTKAKENIRFGTAYIAYLIEKQGIQDARMLAIAYNEGANGAKKFEINPGNHRHAQRVAYAYRAWHNAS